MPNLSGTIELLFLVSINGGHTVVRRYVSVRYIMAVNEIKPARNFSHNVAYLDLFSQGETSQSKNKNDCRE